MKRQSKRALLVLALTRAFSGMNAANRYVFWGECSGAKGLAREHHEYDSALRGQLCRDLLAAARKRSHLSKAYENWRAHQRAYAEVVGSWGCTGPGLAELEAATEQIARLCGVSP